MREDPCTIYSWMWATCIVASTPKVPSCVVRRASWDLLARLDGCTAADAAQPYDSSCELNTTHTLPRSAVSTLDVSALESTTQEMKL